VPGNHRSLPPLHAKQPPPSMENGGKAPTFCEGFSKVDSKGGGAVTGNQKSSKEDATGKR